MRFRMIVVWLLFSGCAQEKAADDVERVKIRLGTCLGPVTAVDGFNSAAPDCRQRIAEYVLPRTPDAEIHACLYAHDSGRLVSITPFRWDAPRFRPLEAASFPAEAERLNVNFMILRAPVAACDPALWNVTCYEEENCVFRLSGQTSSDGEETIIDFRPRGGGACNVESGPNGGPACQGCGWYVDNDDRPCTPTGQGRAEEAPAPICNTTTCQWERPRCQAHCQWGAFELCDGESGCEIRPDQVANDCPCGLDGKGPLVCDPETCSMVAQPCVGVCEPGTMVVADDQVLPDLSGPCGRCGLGRTMAICSDTCQFQGETVCEEPDGLCVPGARIGMQVECTNEGEPGLRQPICGESCLEAEAEPGACIVPAECGPDVPPDAMEPSVEACGRCGLGVRTRACREGRWGPWSKCIEEDIECSPGTIRNIPCDNSIGQCSAGNRAQTCSRDTCTWNAPGECSVLPAEEDLPCNGIDEDCDGLDYTLDRWDQAADNGGCDSATELTPEILSRLYRPGTDITINGSNHEQLDFDYYRIDHRLLQRCGEQHCMAVTFPTPGSVHVAMIFENLDACRRDTSTVFEIWNDQENAALMELAWPRSGEAVYLRVFSAALDLCGDEYGFTLSMPNTLLMDLEAADVPGRGGP